MGNNVELEQRSLLGELIQGRELAVELGNHLRTEASVENRDVLISKILGSYDKALKLLECSEYRGNHGNGGGTREFVAGSSPGSDGSEPEVRVPNRKYSLKKRKTMPQWTKQVKVCMDMGMEGQVDDGFCWRKYGQKDILGANFPRGYYRCTHRYIQGCLATKQVQRSDKDPSIMEITYRGTHTCTQTRNPNSASINFHEGRAAKQAFTPILSKKHSGNAEGIRTGVEPREKIFPCLPFLPTSIESALEEYGFHEQGFGDPSCPSDSLTCPLTLTPLNSLDPVELEHDFPFDTLEFC